MTHVANRTIGIFAISAASLICSCTMIFDSERSSDPATGRMNDGGLDAMTDEMPDATNLDAAPASLSEALQIESVNAGAYFNLHMALNEQGHAFVVFGRMQNIVRDPVLSAVWLIPTAEGNLRFERPQDLQLDKALGLDGGISAFRLSRPLVRAEEGAVALGIHPQRTAHVVYSRAGYWDQDASVQVSNASEQDVRLSGNESKLMCSFYDSHEKTWWSIERTSAGWGPLKKGFVGMNAVSTLKVDSQGRAIAASPAFTALYDGQTWRSAPGMGRGNAANTNRKDTYDFALSKQDVALRVGVASNGGDAGFSLEARQLELGHDPEWSAPVSSVDSSLTTLTVPVEYDLDAEGNLLAVWKSQDRLWSRWLLVGKSQWEDRIELPVMDEALGVEYHRVAVGPAGDAVVSWVDGTVSPHVWAQRLRRGSRSWEAPVRVSSEPITYLPKEDIGTNDQVHRVAVDAAGRAIVVWLDDLWRKTGGAKIFARLLP